MNILVTGLTGFVGKHLGKELARLEAHNIFGLTRKPDHGFPPNITPVQSSLEDIDEVNFPDNIDLVIHLASSVKFNDSLNNLRRVNVDLTREFATLCKKKNVKKFLYLGAAACGLSFDQGQVSTTDNLQRDINFVGPYSLTKYEAETQLIAMHSDDFKIQSLRPPLVWHEVDGFIESVASEIKKGRFKLIQPLNNKISICHVDTLVDKIIKSIDLPFEGSFQYVCDQDPVVMGDFLKKLLHDNQIDPQKLPTLSRRIAAPATRFMGFLAKHFGLQVPITHEQFLLLTESYQFD